MVGEFDAEEFAGAADIDDDLQVLQEPPADAVGAHAMAADAEGAVGGVPTDGGEVGLVGEIGEGVGLGELLGQECGEERGDRGDRTRELGEVAEGKALTERFTTTFLHGQVDGVVAARGADLPCGGALDEAQDDLFPFVLQVQVELADEVPSGLRLRATQGEVEVDVVTDGGSHHAFGGDGVRVDRELADGREPAELPERDSVPAEAEGGRVGGVEDAIDDAREWNLRFEVAAITGFRAPEQGGHGDPEGNDHRGDEVLLHGGRGLQRGGMTSTCPCLRRLASTEGLAAWRAGTPIRYWRAMVERVSPWPTRWVRAGVGCVGVVGVVCTTRRGSLGWGMARLACGAVLG